MLIQKPLLLLLAQYLLFCTGLPSTNHRRRTHVTHNFTSKTTTVYGNKEITPIRRALPSQGTLFREEYYSLECGASYSIAEEGHVYFDLRPGSKPCHYSLLGSKNEECTVAVYCNGTINFAPETDRGCDQEYLLLTDGTEGLMSGCGEFSFRMTPRYPRNDGKDIYVYIRGNERNAICVAYCKEDMYPGLYGLNHPKKISKNHGFNGFWIETQCKCGVRRMMGGNTTVKHEFPWIAAVVVPGTRQPFCDGSLINDRHILTAGHCFQENHDKNKVEVLLHASVLDKKPFHGREMDPTLKDIPGWALPEETDASENSIRRKVMEIRVHPMFDRKTYHYDYAILKLDQPVNLVTPESTGVAPICLPYNHEVVAYQDNDTMTVVGWGIPWEDAPSTSPILQTMDLPYVNRKICLDYTDVTERHICAGYIEGGRNSCSGDAGAPLIYKFKPEDNQYLLAGVVSVTTGCAREGQLGLYSDVEGTFKLETDPIM